MPGKPLLNPEKAAMMALFISGMSFSDIGRAFKRNRSTVQRVSIRDGWVAKRAASIKRLEKKAETTVEAELAENLKILKTLRNLIYNKIVARVGKDGKGSLGIMQQEEIPMLLQTMRDQMKVLGIDRDEFGGGMTIVTDKTIVLQGMPKERRREIERKLLEDLDMVDPALLDEADVKDVK